MCCITLSGVQSLSNPVVNKCLKDSCATLSRDWVAVPNAFLAPENKQNLRSLRAFVNVREYDFLPDSPRFTEEFPTCSPGVELLAPRSSVDRSSLRVESLLGRESNAPESLVDGGFNVISEVRVAECPLREGTIDVCCPSSDTRDSTGGFLHYGQERYFQHLKFVQNVLNVHIPSHQLVIT